VSVAQASPQGPHRITHPPFKFKARPSRLHHTLIRFSPPVIIAAASTVIGLSPPPQLVLKISATCFWRLPRFSPTRTSTRCSITQVAWPRCHQGRSAEALPGH
jgi:hypothetical protein